MSIGLSQTMINTPAQMMYARASQAGQTPNQTSGSETQAAPVQQASPSNHPCRGNIVNILV